MLPAVLFTVAGFETPPWAEQPLRNLHEQILWNYSTSTEAGRVDNRRVAMSRNNKAAEEPRRQIQQLIGPLLHPTPPDQKVEQQQLLQALTSLNSGDKMDDAGGMVVGLFVPMSSAMTP
ncbi:unnamed protein product [Peronospora belbahrii]|uniref:Uncharacterized protein n=1 Tax=Peronospora belbahrii TaxID=622444 RepID=A0AAU9KQV8_9STRA|nr:unnamed protein product [Peronospora belbahrii]